MNSLKKPSLSGFGRFSFITLGCKSNQYDSAAMAAQLERAGLRPGSAGEADVIVVNTCMVTGPTEAQCRKAIRQARRASARARIVVSGCLSAGSREQVEAMEEVDVVIEPGEKGSLAALLGLDASGDWSDWPDDPAVDLGDRDRGFLKVQDGCDAACAYCIVPLVRGPSRSLSPERVLDAVRRLMERGAAEVVLSGIHLGQYGGGLQPATSLEDLLDRLLESDLPGRLRLSSIEPLEITPRLIQTMSAAEGRICRHLHIPLQSGSDHILKAMGRPYLAHHFTEIVRILRTSVPGIGIGCDVICGFPGESERDFQDTLRIIEELQIPFVHAFPYSPRPGTRAAGMADNVPHEVKKERVWLIRKAAEANRHLFASSFVGEVLRAALEGTTRDPGPRPGLTDNYLRVLVKDPCEGMMGERIADILIKGLDGEVLEGAWTRHAGNG
ncbi:MAG: tRNA (N(6)-L-threonylcarbamoyladenosine(37)-C(2))-methylthiotransferase MtaB [bacterium]|nr:MAG: tRNA (N(6)-L-threonylcarbamoyladenosine(37)-C(2))-methylthiotransferase MtaB [bacterium]